MCCHAHSGNLKILYPLSASLRIPPELLLTQLSCLLPVEIFPYKGKFSSCSVKCKVLTMKDSLYVMGLQASSLTLVLSLMIVTRIEYEVGAQAIFFVFDIQLL